MGGDEENWDDLVRPALDSSWGLVAGVPACAAVLRAAAEDFVVEEIPVCAPDGEGEHLWLRVRKRGVNTEWVARRLARWAGVSPRAVGYAGLKDRHGVTAQWFSVQLPGRDDPDIAALTDDVMEVREAARHARKLQRGALRGNRFVLRLRDVTGPREDLHRRVDTARRRGVPNYFGPQRFGRGGGNLARALALFRGQGAPPRRHQRGLYLSAARSLLFNAVLGRRVLEGTWDRAVAGDALQLAGRGSWFPWDAADDTLAARVAAGALHPTGPLWGRGEPPTDAAAGALERAALAPYGEWCRGLEAAGLRQERRALRLPVPDLECTDHGADGVVLRFSLPPGAYATVVMRELAAWTDAGAVVSDA